MKASITCDNCGRTFAGHGNTQTKAEEEAMFKLQEHDCTGPKDSNGKGKSKQPREDE